jgi:hypothetical protein
MMNQIPVLLTHCFHLPIKTKYMATVLAGTDKEFAVAFQAVSVFSGPQNTEAAANAIA